MEEEKIASEEISEVPIVEEVPQEISVEEMIETVIENPTEEVVVEKSMIEEVAPMETLEDSYGRELDREGLDHLNAEQLQRYSICHPDRCPNVGRPMPHSPHVPLYPTDWC